MPHATYASRLRYLPASDLDDSNVDFDGLDVHGRDNEKLGDIDGFIVDPVSARIFYIVVDSGGWFTSRRFLLPIGHSRVDRDAGALRVDVARDTLKRYPAFDANGFEAFSDDDLQAFERDMAQVCCPDDVVEGPALESWYDTRRHYAQPEWWKRDRVPRDLMAISDAYHALARDERPLATGPVASRTVPREDRDRDLVTARERGDDVSPHFEGRAQPGDVLGLETGGERTYIGDTAEDENKRRRTVEHAAPEADDEERGRSER